MRKRRHLQQLYYSLVLVLVIPLATSNFTFARRLQDPQAREKQALTLLRESVPLADPTAADQLRVIESRFPQTRAAALARFLRGRLEYDAGHFAASADILSAPSIGTGSLLGDYALFLRAKALVALHRMSDAEAAFARIPQIDPGSTLARDAALEAAALAAEQGHLEQAMSYLSPLVAAKDPGAMLRLAQFYSGLNDHNHAIELYQEIYFDLPPSREALEAEQHLKAEGLLVKGSTKIPFPRMRQRAEAVYLAQAYSEFVQLYTDFLGAYPQAGRDEELRLHYGISLYNRGSLRRAVAVLKSLKPRSPSLQAERLYYLSECHRRRGNDAAFITINRQLVRQYPQTHWSSEALHSRAKYFFGKGRDELGVKVSKQLLRLQSHSPHSPEASYRVGMAAYSNRRYEEAARYLIRHIANYPNSPYSGPALYWAARAEERRGHVERALAIFARVVGRYRYTVYGQMAEERINSMHTKYKQATPLQPPPRSLLGRALANIKPVRPPKDVVNGEAKLHLEKGRQLRVILLNDFAVKEFMAALKLAPKAPTISLELARVYRDQGDHLAAINIMRRAHPEYTLYQGGEVSDEEERLLFPLTHWKTIRQEAERYGIDPYFIAGLIRQESGFDESAHSRAGARGLMQLIPSTGRKVARRHGMRRISLRRLYDPEVNIRLGVSYLAQLLKQFGKLEYAAAAYNAGPARQARWLRRYPQLEKDEWIERIPFRETRLYVKAVLRNVAHYRRIYGHKSGPVPSL